MDESESQNREERIQQLLDEVADLPPEKRAQRLEEITDPEIQAEVERLLRAHDRLGEIADLMDDLRTEDSGDGPAPGDRVGRFELLSKIGEGGMGVVYEARDTRLDRRVALKFLPRRLGTDPSAKERFLREARTASALDHPHVAPLHEIGDTEDGRPFLVMPYYEGPTLSEKIEGGSLPTGEALELAEQIARGLAAAHQEGIVHRDIKPANVLLPESDTVKLADFGLAKWLDRSGITRTDSVLGTFAYMSPEHARGAEVDYRADLWSLGVVLYEMLAGERPFKGKYQEALLYQIVHEEPPDLREQRPNLPDPLLRLVEELLAKNPDDRPQSAEAVGERLAEMKDRFRSEKQETTTGSEPVRTGRLPRLLQPQKRILGVATAVLLIGALSALWIQDGEPFGLISAQRGAGGAASPTSSDRTVAVLPFEVTGGASEDWRDGMVTMLSTGLDGAGGLRAIPDRRIFAALDGVDTSQVEEGQDPGLVAAREAKAVFAIAGSAVRLGSEMRLSANVYRTKTGERIERVRVDGKPGQFVQAANQLTQQLLAVLLDESGTDLPSVDLAELTTHSPPALKSYLAGERLFRAGDYHAATQEYRAAIKADSTFALAHLRLASTLGWTGEAGFKWAKPLRKAYKLADRLPLRHRRQVWSEYSWGLAGRYKAAADCLKTLTEIYPSDPGFWYEYGEVLFHAAVPRGWPEAETAFKKAVELDPDVAPYRYHLMDLALSVHNDSSLAAKRIKAYPDSPLKRLYQAVWDLNYGTRADREEAWGRLDTLKAPVPLKYWVPWQFSHPTDLDLQARLIRRLRDRPDTDREALTDQLTFNLLDRGHVQEAVARFDQQFDQAGQRCLLARALSLGYSIPDSLLLPVRSSEPTSEEDPGTCGLYRITRGNTASLEGVYERLRSQNDTLAVRSLRGYQAFQSGDLEEARRHWSGFNELGETGAILRGDLYRELGQFEQAEGWYFAAWEHPIAHERLGRLYEQMNRPDAAATGYQWFIDAWKNADPSLQPRVERARERLRVLTEEPNQLSSASEANLPERE